MSRRIEDLRSWLQVLCHDLVQEAAKDGILLAVTQTLRTVAEQDVLYEQGRAKSGKVVTNAKGGESPHNYGLAFDTAFVDTGNHITWNECRPGDWEALGKLGEGLGLVWGGRFRSFPDRPHFEAPRWRTLIGAPDASL